MRQCLFCANPADTIEDAWPLWIADQFRTTVPNRLHAQRGRKPRTSWNVLQPELRIRCVCQQCNNGWMSRLETSVQRLLQPMLHGERCFLDQSEQLIIAVWGVKTAMVLEALGPEHERIYSQTERERLKSLSAMPWRTSVWLAASVDPAVFMSSKTRHMPDMQSLVPMGACTTLALSKFVMQVFTIRVPPQVTERTQVTASVLKGPWGEATVQVWPTQRRTITWPSSVGLNGEEGLDFLANRFATANLAHSDLQLLAV